MPTVIISGFASSAKRPGFFAETVYGAGAISIGSIPLICLVIGNKGASGTATADQDINQVLDVNTADTLYQAGFEITTMCYAALIEQGVLLYGAPNAEAGGAAAATATITIATTATSSGQWAYWIDGVYITGGIASGDVIATTASAISAAINALPRLSVTASPSAGVVTLTSKSKGTRALDHTLFQDASKMATSQTSVIAGGTSLTGGGVKFTGGTGSDSLTNVFTVLFPGHYDRIAIAQYDATNAAAFVTQLNSKAGVLQGRLEHGVMATSTSFAAATTLATTSLNAERVQLLWLLNSPTHPPCLAARMAAKRTSSEASNPAADYDDVALTGSTTFPILGQFAAVDNPTATTQESALNNGVTPLKTVGGQVVVVRSITSHSLSGSTPDYRTLDTSAAYIPDFVRNDADLLWTTEYRPANPLVQDDPPSGVKPPVSGIATPTKWMQRYTARLKQFEAGTWGGPPIIQQVDTYPMTSGFDNTAKRIMSTISVVPVYTQHQIGISVRGLTG